MHTKRCKKNLSFHTPRLTNEKQDGDGEDLFELSRTNHDLSDDETTIRKKKKKHLIFSEDGKAQSIFEALAKEKESKKEQEDDEMKLKEKREKYLEKLAKKLNENEEEDKFNFRESVRERRRKVRDPVFNQPIEIRTSTRIERFEETSFSLEGWYYS
jgi:hypothetical protein